MGLAKLKLESIPGYREVKEDEFFNYILINSDNIELVYHNTKWNYYDKYTLDIIAFYYGSRKSRRYFIKI